MKALKRVLDSILHLLNIHTDNNQKWLLILQFGLHPQALVAIENKIPQGSGILDGEGNVIGHPVKRQYCALKSADTHMCGVNPKSLRGQQVYSSLEENIKKRNYG